MKLRYKFVEVQPVTASAIEDVVNKWVGDGWRLDKVRFVGVAKDRKRPALAFISFVRSPTGGVVELGELDLGDAAPFEVEIDWGAAKQAPKAKRKARR